jgi:DNA-binding FrmR family transcriptional regulator
LASGGSANLSGELDWTAQLLSKAQNQAAALDDGVKAVQAKVAGNFPGIARNLDQLHPLIQEIQARIDALTGQVTTLAKQAQVDDDATPDEVVVALTPIKNSIDGVVTGMLGVLDNLDRLDALVAQCLKGGAPEDLLYQANQVRLEMRDALKAVHGADKATDAKLAEAKKAGKA